jgi:hypothetical protein
MTPQDWALMYDTLAWSAQSARVAAERTGNISERFRTIMEDYAVKLVELAKRIEEENGIPEHKVFVAWRLLDKKRSS